MEHSYSRNIDEYCYVLTLKMRRREIENNNHWDDIGFRRSVVFLCSWVKDIEFFDY